MVGTAEGYGVSRFLDITKDYFKGGVLSFKIVLSQRKEGIKEKERR
jgi:hypothetical protein